MRHAGKISFGRCRLHVDTAVTAVKTGAIDMRVVDDRRAVDVRHTHIADVVDAPVVGKPVMVPMATLIPDTGITEAIADSTIVSNMRTPITAVPIISLIGPAPIARCPKRSDIRRQHPSPWHPIIIVVIVAPGPIAGRPHVTVTWNRRLDIHRQLRRCNVDRYGNVCLG